MDNEVEWVYGIKVSKEDPRYSEFINELKNDEEGELFELHEDWCGVFSVLLPNDEVVVGYAVNVGTQKEILDAYNEEPEDYGSVILDFLGNDYNINDLQFHQLN